ncbi:MAG: phosphoribosylglycinamide formyltransferase [Clostridia bacterium]|nr:phosphoribosylglycinamide formyltransferase [Clostridia bacterium]
MKNKVKIAVLVSGGGTNLQALIDAVNKGIIKNGEISVVISNNSSAFALERAKNNGIEGLTILKKDFADQLAFEQKIKDVIKERGVELIVLAGFMSILSENFTREFSNRIINVHPSLIPSFCGKGYYGLKVHEEALKKGVKVTGATVHFVNEIPDGGEIIMQKAVKVRDNDTPEILQRRVMEQAEWKILPQSVEKICKKIIKEK